MTITLMPIKVLHIRSSPFLGSPEKLILGHIKHIKRSEYQYILGIFDEQSGKENDFYTSARRLHSIPIIFRDSILWFFFNLIRIYKTCISQHIQIICTHDYKSNFYGIFLKKLLRVPIMSVFHGRTGADFKVRLYEKLDDFILRYFDAIVCVSEHTRQKIKTTIGNSVSMHVIPNAVDIEDIEQSCNANNDELDGLRKNNEKLAVYAGRLSKEKGLLYFIEAAKIISSKRKDVKFLILGEGPEKKKLENSIADNQLNEFVSVVGFKNNIYEYYKAMDFLVLPSLTEGMPMVILEAFALRKTVVASKVGGVPEIIRHKVNGLLVRPMDATDLAEAMNFLMSNAKAAQDMGNNAYAFVKTKHTMRAHTEHYVSVYRRLLSSK